MREGERTREVENAIDAGPERSRVRLVKQSMPGPIDPELGRLSSICWAR